MTVLLLEESSPSVLVVGDVKAQFVNRRWLTFLWIVLPLVNHLSHLLVLIVLVPLQYAVGKVFSNGMGSFSPALPSAQYTLRLPIA